MTEFTKLFQNGNHQHRSHNKNLLTVHLIFVTKYRKKFIFGDFRDAVKQYIFDVCCKHNWYIKRMETDKDHIHILLQYNPIDSITNICSIIKQHSTFYAWQNYSGILKKYYWGKHVLWSAGYFAASVGMVSKSIIEKYIESQG